MLINIFTPGNAYNKIIMKLIKSLCFLVLAYMKYIFKQHKQNTEK